MEQVLNQIRLSPAGARAAREPEAVAALLEQLGSMEELVSITAAPVLLQNAPVHDVQTLAVFIETYLQEVLIPVELPLIYKAFLHASRNECRELILLDRSAADRMRVEQFANASRRVGHQHVRAMRPIRGERLVQRYLAAVESGEANGWHMIVYGITLALFSLPARQGMMHYAYRTMGGLVQAAARSLHLTERECREIVGDLCDDVPQAIEAILAGA